MKKVLVTLTLLVVGMMMSFTCVNATTNAELIEFATSNHVVSGESIGLTAENRVKVERYLQENPVTDDEANQIMAKANELIALMESAGVSDPAKLSQEDKAKFISIAQEGAAVIGLDLVFKAGSVDVYKDGVLIETAALADAPVPYTGSNVNVALVVSSVAVIALAMGIVAKKRVANA